MRRMTRAVAAIAALAIISGACRSYRTAGTDLRGAIFDGQLPLPGIDVFVTRVGGSEETRVVTDVQGQFVLRNLAPGTYFVQPRMSGFEAVPRLEVRVPQDHPVSFAMRPAPSGPILGGAEPPRRGSL